VHSLLPLIETYRTSSEKLWLDYDTSGFKLISHIPKSQKHRKEIVLRFYEACETYFGISPRCAWNASVPVHSVRLLPSILSQDTCLHLFTEALPLTLQDVVAIYDALQKTTPCPLEPLQVHRMADAQSYHGVVGAPPTLFSKFFHHIRLQKDALLLEKIADDLERLTSIEDHMWRRYLTLAILSHGAVYRELEGQRLLLPSFHQAGHLEAYHCIQHLIDDGVKTVSLFPENPQEPGLYLCQGTELWPSQRSALGSILANFATHGSATAAYAHSWRRIHKHLRDLRKSSSSLPFVAGHSMGGALAIQIMLYSHAFIDTAYAFNPPLPSQRDEEFFMTLSPEIQEKLQIHANLDDFAFWRIGEKVFGHVTIWLAITRYRYSPVTLWDTITVLPALYKIFMNLTRAFPAHQNLFALEPLSVRVRLSPREIALENRERLTRFDYLRFFPKLYDPMRNLIRLLRRLFGWTLQAEYLQNEIEIVLLHEQDLLDSVTESNREEKESQLALLRKQKERLLKELSSLISPADHP